MKSSRATFTNRMNKLHIRLPRLHKTPVYYMFENNPLSQTFETKLAIISLITSFRTFVLYPERPFTRVLRSFAFPISFLFLLAEKKTVPPVPLRNTSTAVYALTLHHGGTEPPYGDNRHKKCLSHCGRFPRRWVCYALQIYKHFYKNKTLFHYLAHSPSTPHLLYTNRYTRVYLERKIKRSSNLPDKS